MNLANKLTMMRVILVPVFIILMMIDTFWTNVFALIIFITASVTDFFDGRIARKQNIVTTFGIFLDPLADKLLVASAFISFVSIYILNVPAWMVICIIAREFIITGLRSIAASKNIIIPASMSGKVKTTSQMIAIITILVILVVNSALIKFYSLTPYDLVEGTKAQKIFGLILLKAPFWLMLIATIFTVYSGISYIYQHRELFSDK
ncbi:MAG: CDP-diacylglycerol--glycerol-3-phosphate 3-phosphatidyltransferase [Elusimicrobia bacterium]|nr:CDP-diacylglycerol--glycerol-3-phosphate 3-phosphatidyltransferase [Elusimicrobiota bacterium]